MRTRWVVVVVASIAAAVFLPAVAADAHAVFVSAGSVPVNSTQELVMNVPHEREDGIYNVKVEVAVPAAWNAENCQTKATWTCTIGTQDGAQVVTWTKGNGSSPAEDETFRFSVRTAPTTGTYAFPTIQTYSDGEEVAWIGGAGTAEPAPTLKTVPATTGSTTTTPTTRPPSHPTTSRPGSQPHTSNPGGPSPTIVGGSTTTADPNGTSTTGVDDTSTTSDPDGTTTTEHGDDPGDGRSRSGGTGSTPGGDDAGSDEQATGSDGNGDGGSALPFALGGVVLVAGAASAGAVLWRRRQAGA